MFLRTINSYINWHDLLLLTAPYNTPFFCNSLRKSRKYFNEHSNKGTFSGKYEPTFLFYLVYGKKKSEAIPSDCLPDTIKFTCFASSLYFILKGKNKMVSPKENIQLKIPLGFMQLKESRSIFIFFTFRAILIFGFVLTIFYLIIFHQIFIYSELNVFKFIQMPSVLFNYNRFISRVLIAE